MEKYSVLVLCKKMEKLRNYDILKTPMEEWKHFMSNNMFLPRLDFESLHIDKKSPILKEDFILSQKGPLENNEKYYIFNVTITKPLMYNYLMTCEQKQMKSNIGKMNQCYFTQTQEKQIFWDTILEGTMSDPIDMNKSGITKIELVVYFCYKLLFKTRLRRVKLTQKVKHYQLNQKSVMGNNMVLSHQVTEPEYTPKLLVILFNYLLALISHYQKLIAEAKHYKDVLPELRRFALFKLAGLYRPDKISPKGKENSTTED